MRTSIFDLEIRIDIKTEFKKLVKILFEQETILYGGICYSLYDFLNDEVFPLWKYKGTCIDINDFFKKTNLRFDVNDCNEENFLFILELLLNLWPIGKRKLNNSGIDYQDKKVIGYMNDVIKSILEGLNYCIVEYDDRFIIEKRDADVDSILEILPNDIGNLLLAYNDIRNNNIEAKKSILKKIDLFIENDKKNYKSIGGNTYDTVQKIVNNMGINHPIDKEPYNKYSNEKLIYWYDNCFKLMIHLIRMKTCIELNDVVKKLGSEN